ncbi:MAG: adenosine kinase [Leptospirales bacterium]|nr:adenosine kinase [Leptospirales bacterium]
MKRVDVYGVGNSLVDTLAFVESDFIREHDLTPGSMALVDSEKQARILRALSKHSLELRSGGSAANTMIAVSRSGGSAFYTGKVSRDTNGEFYRQDLLAAGIHFDVHPSNESDGTTGTCVVLTTPDAERTMLTHLGVSVQLTAADIDEDKIKQSRIIYIEGYLWAGEGTRAASIRAAELGKKNGVPVSFTFSDSFLLQPFRDDFRHFVTDYCDVVFCNAPEVKSFSEMTDLDEAVRFVGRLTSKAFVTDGEKGAIVVDGGSIVRVPGFSVTAIDTNGAGDSFAGGTLFGLTHEQTAVKSARWGNYLASEIVQIQGARLNKNYAGDVARVLAD